MRSLKNKKIAAIAAGAVLVGSAGAAYAYWTTTGGGSGSATTAAGNAEALEVEQDSTVTDMFPGDTEQDVDFTVTNTGSENYFVKSVTVKISDVVDAAGQTVTGCDLTDYELGGTQADADGVTIDLGAEDAGVDLVPAGSGASPAAGSTVSDSTTLQFFNKDEPQDECKGATVELTYTTNAS